MSLQENNDDEQKDDDPYCEMCPVCLCGKEVVGWMVLSCGHACHTSCVQQSVRYGYNYCCVCFKPLGIVVVDVGSMSGTMWHDSELSTLVRRRRNTQIAFMIVIAFETFLVTMGIKFSKDIHGSSGAGPFFIAIWLMCIIAMLALISNLISINRALRLFTII